MVERDKAVAVWKAVVEKSGREKGGKIEKKKKWRY